MRALPRGTYRFRVVWAGYLKRRPNGSVLAGDVGRGDVAKLRLGVVGGDPTGVRAVDHHFFLDGRRDGRRLVQLLELLELGCEAGLLGEGQRPDLGGLVGREFEGCVDMAGSGWVACTEFYGVEEEQDQPRMTGEHG